MALSLSPLVRVRMKEERRKAYLNLINALLNCSSGEEPQILNANQDLLDAGFIASNGTGSRVFREEGRSQRC